MEERIDSENVQQIDLISMLKDIGRDHDSSAVHRSSTICRHLDLRDLSTRI